MNNDFNIDKNSFMPTEKPKIINTVDKPVKWAMSKIFWLEGIIVILATLLISVANVQLGVTNGIQPISTVIRSILLWICSYLMYTVYLSWGSQKGKETKDYQKAIEEYQTEKKKILENDYTKLAKYCIYYIKDELKNNRISVLSEIGMRYEEYEKNYLGKSTKEIENLNIPEDKKAVIIQANLIKPTKLTPSMLMVSNTVNSRNLLSTDVETIIKKDKFIKIITSAFFSLVIGSVFIDVSILNGWSILISCLLNLLPLVLNIFMGGYQGFKAYSVNEVNNLNGKVTHFKNCQKFDATKDECEQMVVKNENKEI